MASNVSQKPYECQICLNYYDDDRRPRSTICGHTFCTGCMEDNLKFGILKCPRCRKEQRALSVDSFPVNYDMEALIAYMRPPTGKKPQGDNRGICQRLEIIKDEQDKEARQLLNLDEYGSGIESYMATLEECLEIQLYFLRSGSLKNSLAAIDKELDRVAEIDNSYIVKKMKLEDQLEIAKTLESVESLSNYIDGTDQCIVELQEAIKPIGETLLNAKEMFKAIQDEKHPQHVLDVVESNAKYFKLVSASLLGACLTGSVVDHLDFYNGKKLTANDLKNTTEKTRKLIDEGRVFAVLEKDGVVYSAKISILDGKVLLYAFQEKAPPARTYRLPYDELKSLLDPKSTLVFLFMSWGLSTADGFVFIKISSETAYGQQFVMLCSGERGISYRKSKSFKIFDGFGESLYCGKFENDKDKEAGTLLKGLKAGEEYFWPCSEGSVAGAGGDGPEFIIIHRSWTLLPYWHQTGFGKIESGLDYIGHAIKECRGDLGKIQITECGVVLATVE